MAAFWSNSLAEIVFLVRRSFARSSSICAKFQLRLHALELGCGPIEVRLIRTRIDHVKQVALLNDRPGFEMDLGNIAGHARANIDRLDCLQSSR